MKKFIIFAAVVLILGGGGAAYYFYGSKTAAKKSEIKIVSPEIGKIEVSISTTGTVQPKNRVEIKPTVAGRVDSILVAEGDMVKKGQILALMSSTERAVLIDAARSQGKEAVKHWEEVYKQTPIIAQIDGEVIVRSVEPGQSVTQTTAMLVLSDRLIVNAKVDETDIGKVEEGQEARISLDAYPDVKETGAVGHISYESKIVNNVTTYDVEIVPRNIPEVFRSGMSAAVNIIQERKKNILVLPLAAVKRESNKRNSLSEVKSTGLTGGTESKSLSSRADQSETKSPEPERKTGSIESTGRAENKKGREGRSRRDSGENKVKKASIENDGYVMVIKEGVPEPVKVAVKTGMADSTNIEIISGVGPEDKVVIDSKKFVLTAKSETGSSPFMPTPPRAATGARGR